MNIKFEVEIRDFEPFEGELTTDNIEDAIRDFLDRREDDGIIIVTEK